MVDTAGGVNNNPILAKSASTGEFYRVWTVHLILQIWRDREKRKNMHYLHMLNHMLNS